jgi:hypothetical protein
MGGKSRSEFRRGPLPGAVSTTETRRVQPDVTNLPSPQGSDEPTLWHYRRCEAFCRLGLGQNSSDCGWGARGFRTSLVAEQSQSQSQRICPKPILGIASTQGGIPDVSLSQSVYRDRYSKILPTWNICDLSDCTLPRSHQLNWPSWTRHFWYCCRNVSLCRSN